MEVLYTTLQRSSSWTSRYLLSACCAPSHIFRQLSDPTGRRLGKKPSMCCVHPSHVEGYGTCLRCCWRTCKESPTRASCRTGEWEDCSKLLSCSATVRPADLQIHRRHASGTRRDTHYLSMTTSACHCLSLSHSPCFPFSFSLSVSLSRSLFIYICI